MQTIIKYKEEYAAKLKDPRWQKKRLTIFERDDWTCQNCFDTESTLAVHHRIYLPNIEPWDYPDELLITYCEDCHEQEKIDYPLAEQCLLKEVRSKLSSSNIISLASGIHCLEFYSLPDVVMDSYSWALGNYECQKEIDRRYFIELKKLGLRKDGQSPT